MKSPSTQLRSVHHLMCKHLSVFKSKILNFKVLKITTCFGQYGHHQLLKSSGGTAAILLFYMCLSDAHMCCAWCVMLPLVLRCLFVLVQWHVNSYVGLWAMLLMNIYMWYVCVVHCDWLVHWWEMYQFWWWIGWTKERRPCYCDNFYWLTVCSEYWPHLGNF
jgi:hypothetical protein